MTRSCDVAIIGASLTGSTYRQRWLIVDLATTRERLRHTRVVCDPARPLITLPGPDGIRRYEFMLHDDEDETAASDGFALIAYATRRPPSPPTSISARLRCTAGGPAGRLQSRPSADDDRCRTRHR